MDLISNYALWGQIATLITGLAYFPYIFSILKHKTKPDRTTWSVLFLIGIITFFAYQEVGAIETLGVALANVIGPFVIFLLSIKYGEGWKNISDFKYLAFSLIAVILWRVYDSALIGLIFNLVADLIAFIPTIKKSFFRPWTEDFLTWGLFVFGGVVNLFAIESWSFEIVIYPAYILLAEGSVFVILMVSYFKKRT